MARPHEDDRRQRHPLEPAGSGQFCKIVLRENRASRGHHRSLQPTSF
jgi:hypothetical protein